MYVVYHEDDKFIKEVVLKIVEYRKKPIDSNSVYKVELHTMDYTYVTDTYSVVYNIMHSYNQEIDLDHWKGKYKRYKKGVK